MTYIKMIDEATGQEITDAELTEFEWIETTNHSTSSACRTFTRGRRIPKPQAEAPRLTADEVLRFLGVLDCEIITHMLTWDIIETEPVNGYKNWTTGPTGKIVVKIRRKHP